MTKCPHCGGRGAWLSVFRETWRPWRWVPEPNTYFENPLKVNVSMVLRNTKGDGFDICMHCWETVS